MQISFITRMHIIFDIISRTDWDNYSDREFDTIPGHLHPIDANAKSAAVRV